MNDMEAATELEKRMKDLRIITNVANAKAKTGDPRDPNFNVLEPVDHVEETGQGTVLAAIGTKGSLTIGQPVDLLVRLLEWQYYDPADPMATRERVLAALA